MRPILIVEDEPAIADLIEMTLEPLGQPLIKAHTGNEAANLLESTLFDLILLDVMLPGVDGFTLMDYIAPTGTPVIFLTAKATVEDRVRGLRLGAYDYIVKPFAPPELLARVEALCRRVSRTAGGDEKEKSSPLGMLTSGEFVLDENRRVLLKAGQPIELTQVEFQIMELFFRNPGIALVREKILKGVWGENYFGDVKIVDVNIRRLRMKVEDEPSKPAHILTVWGYGYRWEE